MAFFGSSAHYSGSGSTLYSQPVMLSNFLPASQPSDDPRTVKACDYCRSIKSKCSRAILHDGTVITSGPCKNCLSNGKDCTYNRPVRRRGPAKGYIAATEQRLRRMESLMQGIIHNDDPEVQDLIREVVGDDETLAMLREDSSLLRQRLIEANNAPPDAHLNRSLRPGGFRDGSSPFQSVLGPKRVSSADKRHLGIEPMPTRVPHTGINNHPRADGMITDMGSDSDGSGELDERSDLAGQLALNPSGEVVYVSRMTGLYLIADSAKYRDYFWRFEPPPSLAAGVGRPAHPPVPLPDRSLRVALLNLFMERVHPHLPILHPATFLRQCEAQFELDPEDQDEQSVMVQLVVSSLATRFAKGLLGGQQLLDAGDLWYEVVKKMLNNCYAASRLSTCQVLIFLSFRELLMGDTQAARMHTAMAIRMGQDLGLMRDSERWKVPAGSFSKEVQHDRKRVWWSYVILDCYESAHAGQPLAIDERSFDTAPPSIEPSDHRGLKFLKDPYGASIFVPESENTVHALSCFVQNSSLSMILMRILSGLYSITTIVVAHASGKLVSLLDRQLTGWYTALPEELRYEVGSATDHGGGTPTPQVLSLHMQFYTCLLLLHRPFVVPGDGKDEEGARDSPSFAACDQAATAICRLVDAYAEHHTLGAASPLLVGPICAAFITHAFNTSYRRHATAARKGMRDCLDALKEMSSYMPAALAQSELLSSISSEHWHDRPSGKDPSHAEGPVGFYELGGERMPGPGSLAGSAGLNLGDADGGFASLGEVFQSVPQALKPTAPSMGFNSDSMGAEFAPQHQPQQSNASPGSSSNLSSYPLSGTPPSQQAQAKADFGNFLDSLDFIGSTGNTGDMGFSDALGPGGYPPHSGSSTQGPMGRGA